MKEVWKDIVGYEGLYLVSNLGAVYGCKTGTTKKAVIKFGYETTMLRKDGEYKDKRIHRLVGESFIPNKYNKPHINHINGVKNDNRVSSLEGCTPKENLIHSMFILGRIPGVVGFEVLQLSKTGRFIRERKSVSSAALGVGLKSVSGIYGCISGTVKTAGGYRRIKG